MDRNREVRRATMAATNGLSRRRHRSNSLRDSPEEDGPVELQETVRLRDRGNGKKDRDRERERERERDRDRDRDRDRLSRNKRRRGDRLIHGSNREDGEESTEESVNDEEEEFDDDGGGGGGGTGGVGVRMLPPNPTSLSSSAMSNHHHQQQHHRKSFPPAKVFRPSPSWKPADEMIGVSVPRKARSASTKRSHECWNSGSGGVGGEQNHRQASTSPVRPSLVPSSSPAAPVSPSSSNASVRKKMKPNGPKHRPPPKSSSKSSSSNQDEIEIEIAEVLYGMMTQPQSRSKQEIIANESMKFDSREGIKSTGDAKSRVSSPISNSPSVPPQNSSSSATPMVAIAPKRKKPRPVSYNDENPLIFAARSSPISSTTKADIDQPTKIETTSSNLDKNLGSMVENGGVSCNLVNSQDLPPSIELRPESVKPEINALSDSKPLTEEPVSRDVIAPKEEEAHSPKKESPRLKLDDDRDDTTSTKANSTASGIESHREEKFQIDLMAPPPQLRSSPERDGEISFVAKEPKPILVDVETTEMKPKIKEDEKVVKMGNVDGGNAEPEEKKAKAMVVEEAESQKPVVNKERFIDLQLDLEKNDKDSGTGGLNANKMHHHVPKQQQPQSKTTRDDFNTEKTGQSTNPLPLPMSVASWPGGLPPMGYMAPLQGVVSMDGSTVSTAAIQPPHFFSQPRPKRCATHYYIARNICCYQQFTRMNPFWPAAAGSASLYGAKPCNLNAIPSTEMHGNIPGRGVNPMQDKGQGLAIFPGHSGKEKGSQAANILDAAQRKQILLQQAIPPGAPSNILHGPAFIFPLGQQQAAAAAAAASVRPGFVKSPPTTGTPASSSASNSVSVSVSATAAAAAAATAMSFNYPNMPETQYLAILQNNGYPFPIPPHVGGPPAYRGTHAQAMPFFNGSFYSSQMLHPSQLQQQQQQQQQQPQNQQIQQGHQNTSISSGSSSSQKHLQNQQQRPQGSGINGGSGSLQCFPAPKNRSSQTVLQQQHQHIPQPHQARQLETEVGGEDSPSTADSRLSRANNMGVYGQNFPMPIHPQNFALMAPPVSLGGASGTGSNGASGNHSEKKQQQPQQQGLKAGIESIPSQAFAMSFASINGAATAPGIDISAMAQNQAIFQNFPEVARHGYHQMMAAAAAAQAAQQKKNYRISEEGKTGPGDSSNGEEERKAMAGKGPVTPVQSIAFSRPDLTDTSISTIPGNTVIDTSARTLNLGSAASRASGSVMPAVISTVNSPNSQQQQRQQQQQQQQQQIMQLQKQQQQYVAAAAAAARKTPATSNGNVYSDHLPSSSSMAAKFPNALSAFPQNLVQSSSSSPAQTPQWKNSARTTTSQVPSPSMGSSTSSSLKNLPQQQGRTQQSHTQISFGGNPKSSTASQGQQPPSSNLSPSPPMVVGSPTTSSISKSAGGSPRNASTSTGNKAGQASTLSSQQAKGSSSVPGRKSSPVGGRNVPSIPGNPHITSSSSPGTKPQLPQQHQQQHQQHQQHQVPKQTMQQAQLFFSNAYMQAQAPNSTSTTSTNSATSGYYLQRRRSEQQQQPPQGSSATSSTGMLSLCTPVTLAGSSTSDPAKAIAAAAAAAAAASNMKGGGLPSQGILHSTQFATAQTSGNPHQLVPAGFPYMHAVPTAVQVKPAEQKQPAGE